MTSQPNAVQILKEDHQRIRKDILALTRTDLREPSAVDSIHMRVLRELEFHFRLLDEFLLPALSDLVESNSQDEIERVRRQEDELRHLLVQLTALSPSDSAYASLLTEFQSAFQEHCDEEEAALYIEAEQILGSELNEMGEQMLERRQQLYSLEERSGKPSEPFHRQAS